MITFVIYHVPLPEETVKVSKVLLPFHRMGFNYDQLLDLTFQSAVLFHPQCRLVLLTSLKYQPKISTSLFDKLEVFRYDVDAAQPMAGRCWAELQYLQQHDFASHVVVLDSDMLVNTNLEDIFDTDFDIALTYNEGKGRAEQRMPLNGGLKIAQAQKKRGSIQFFQQISDLCNSEHLKAYRTWWGDQYALIEAIGADNFWHRQSDNIQVDGINLQLLPCDTYNFSPHKKARGIKKEWKEKKIIHFKGPRKRYMPLYWNLYLNPHNKDDVYHKRKVLRARTQLHLKALFGLK